MQLCARTEIQETEGSSWDGGSPVLLLARPILWFRLTLAIFCGSRRAAQNGESLGHMYDVMQIKTSR